MERINSRKRNIIGCLFRHPNMGVSDFNKNFLNILLDKLSKENNQDFHLGQFNFSILNYTDHQPVKKFLDSITSDFFIPYILQPTRIP